MGLSLYAYSNLREMKKSEVQYNENDEELENPQNGRSFFIDSFFADSANDIQEKVVYTYEDAFHWRGGSYTGYGLWRDWLAKMAGWKSIKDAWENSKPGMPFHELLYFSDCEGTIGTSTCQKLLKDFINFQEKVLAYKNPEDYYAQINIEQYKQWIKGLTIASKNGAISFG